MSNYSAFTAESGIPPAPAVRGEAPGRVNLMGDHTDYNLGYVLPTPIPQTTRVTLSVRDDDRVIVRSTHMPAQDFDYRLGHEQRTEGWPDYVQGVTRELAKHVRLPSGFELDVHSDVPMGAGLSSSAALEVAVARALRAAFELSLDDITIARAAQEAETSFVGVPVGIMDQMVASLGKPGSALFIDTRDLSFEYVAIPPQLELVVIDSGITHAHSAGEYRIRRRECELAAAELGLASLRELGTHEARSLSTLEPSLARRVRHVSSENARVLEMVSALAACDRPALRELFAASHSSLRDDYAVSIPEIDVLVQLAEQEPHVVGARLTGGGFGGSVVMLAERGEGASAARRIRERYQERTGAQCSVLVPEIH